MSGLLLLIEDNDQNAYLMRYLLERGGFSVIVAEDGPSGIAAALERRPRAILLDIQLPGLDGYGVAGALRARPELADTPIVAVTSYAMPGDRERILAAGADAYIEKPIDPCTFAADVTRHLAEREGEGNST